MDEADVVTDVDWMKEQLSPLLKLVVAGAVKSGMAVVIKMSAEAAGRTIEKWTQKMSVKIQNREQVWRKKWMRKSAVENNNQTV